MNSSDNPMVINQLPISVDFEETDFLDNLTSTYKKIANTVNAKTGGLYQPQEISNSEQFFTTNDPQKQRNVYRMTVDFGALPNTASKSVSHGINFTSEFTLTKAYASSSDTDNLEYIPIPYASATGADIELSINASTVTITTNSDRTNFNITYVVIEYCKTQ